MHGSKNFCPALNFIFRLKASKVAVAHVKAIWYFLGAASCSPFGRCCVILPSCKSDAPCWSRVQISMLTEVKNLHPAFADPKDLYIWCHWRCSSGECNGLSFCFLVLRWTKCCGTTTSSRTGCSLWTTSSAKPCRRPSQYWCQVMLEHTDAKHLTWSSRLVAWWRLRGQCGMVQHWDDKRILKTYLECFSLHCMVLCGFTGCYWSKWSLSLMPNFLFNYRYMALDFEYPM